jgi:hypothetical protein
LPVRDNQNRPFAAKTYQRLCDELTDGGVTAFTRPPAAPLKNAPRVSFGRRGTILNRGRQFGLDPERCTMRLLKATSFGQRACQIQVKV